MLNFEQYMATQLAERRDENIRKVIVEVKSGNISKATRKRIATQAFKAGQEITSFIEDIPKVRYAAAMVATDPKKQIKNEELVKGYLKLHGLSMPTNVMCLIQEDDGGDQRKNRVAFAKKVKDAAPNTVLLVQTAVPVEIETNNNVIFIGTVDEYVERH